MFQNVMDTLLQGIPGVACFIDDIIVTGATEEEHLKSLERAMKVLQDHGVRLKLPMQMSLHARSGQFWRHPNLVISKSLEHFWV